VQDQRQEDFTRANDHMAIFASLEQEMTEMRQRNEEEIHVLRHENEKMRMKNEREAIWSPSFTPPRRRRSDKNIFTKDTLMLQSVLRYQRL